MCNGVRCTLSFLLTPCCRVVSKSDMGGFAEMWDGLPLKIKARLLDHEGVSI